MFYNWNKKRDDDKKQLVEISEIFVGIALQKSLLKFVSINFFHI